MSQLSARQLSSIAHPPGAVLVELAPHLAPHPGQDGSGRLAAANDDRPGPEPRPFGATPRIALPVLRQDVRPTVHPLAANLDTEALELTVLFADIRGFSALSEALKDDPLRLARLTDAVLGAMAEIVAAHGGTIDKFVGDSIMAVWGAPFADPLQASHAVAAAEALLAGIEALNDRLDLSLPDGGALPPVRIGVGVNSGRCAVGRIGSATRRDYTVLGDAVNVAARLVGMTKAYGLDLLIGEATAAQLPASRRRREVDCIAPRGCVERQCVFALTPSEPDPGDGSAAPGSRSLH